jgi:hypothetical protein
MNEYEVKSLPHALQDEIERCLVIRGHAIEIGNPGLFLKLVVERDIKLARNALAEADAAAMVRCYAALKEYKE